MRADTFKEWLRERGCEFDQAPRGRGAGHASLVVKRGARRSLLPEIGSHHDLEEDDVRRVVEELELPWAELPGPASRA
jgi:hypothetical protein